jgi:hypothetical protein
MEGELLAQLEGREADVLPYCTNSRRIQRITAYILDPTNSSQLPALRSP